MTDYCALTQYLNLIQFSTSPTSRLTAPRSIPHPHFNTGTAAWSGPPPRRSGASSTSRSSLAASGYIASPPLPWEQPTRTAPLPSPLLGIRTNDTGQESNAVTQSGYVRYAGTWCSGSIVVIKRRGKVIILIMRGCGQAVIVLRSG